MCAWHSEELRQHWLKFSRIEQMANIGSEVHRTIAAAARGDAHAKQLAYERALELFDFTLDDPQWITGRKEVVIAREVFCDLIIGGNTYHTDPDSLDRYFTQFAVAAQRQRGL